MSATTVYTQAVHAMASHISNCLKTHRARSSTRSTHSPLFVGIQGPQGSGKTFLTSRLRSLLADPPYGLSIAVLSIDDLYLPHAGLTTLAKAYPQNRLLHGRGLPGTHDVPLGRALMAALQAINETGDGIALPIFDKSLYDGAGDRAAETHVVRPPLDVVVLEGWCVGFFPISRTAVEARWTRGAVPELEAFDGGRGFDVRAHATLEDVLVVNEKLRAYVEWWQSLGAFIQIRGPSSSSLGIIYRWRLQQEHDMKAKNGGRGMTDEQVKTFVDRYIPGYVFFGDGVRDGGVEEGGERIVPPWLSQGLVLELDEERQLVNTHQF